MSHSHVIIQNMFCIYILYDIRYIFHLISLEPGSGHYGDVMMGSIASEITSLTIVYSTVYSDADQRKLHSSASLAFVRGIHRGPVNSPHKWPVTRKMFPFDDVIMGMVLCGEATWHGPALNTPMPTPHPHPHPHHPYPHPGMPPISVVTWVALSVSWLFDNTSLSMFAALAQNIFIFCVKSITYIIKIRFWDSLKRWKYSLFW